MNATGATGPSGMEKKKTFGFQVSDISAADVKCVSELERDLRTTENLEAKMKEHQRSEQMREITRLNKMLSDTNIKDPFGSIKAPEGFVFHELKKEKMHDITPKYQEWEKRLDKTLGLQEVTQTPEGLESFDKFQQNMLRLRIDSILSALKRFNDAKLEIDERWLSELISKASELNALPGKK